MSSSSAPAVTSKQKAGFHHHNGGGGRRQNSRNSLPTSRNAPLFDSHCHIGLGFSYAPSKKDPTPANCPDWPFLDQDGMYACEEQFVRALDAGVKKMALIGIDDVTSTRVQLISAHLNRLALGDDAAPIAGALHAYWTAGIHPHSAHLHDAQFPAIESLIRTVVASERGLASSSSSSSAASPSSFSRLVAIGETGMDFFKSKGSLEDQRASLWRHLLLAYELDLPVIIHARNADDDLIVTFEDFIAEKKREQAVEAAAEGGVSKTQFGGPSADSPWRRGQIRGVMHCFSSDAHWMERYLALGFFISFTNNITYPKSVGIQDACARCPADRIVIETDSPFLPPQRVRGGTNEPANTRDTFECACKLRGIFGNDAAMDALQKQLWENTHRLFNLPL